jgi:hypothetical protein
MAILCSALPHLAQALPHALHLVAILLVHLANVVGSEVNSRMLNM